VVPPAHVGKAKSVSHPPVKRKRKKGLGIMSIRIELSYNK
jgi:hypothetical protein